MNKKFFEGMKTFSLITLIAGIVAAGILLFTSVFVKVETGIYYTFEETVFNASGFVSMLACLIGSIALYYIIKGIALLGLKMYDNEDVPKDSADSEPKTQEQIADAQKSNRTIINVIIITIIIVLIAVCLSGFIKR